METTHTHKRHGPRARPALLYFGRAQNTYCYSDRVVIQTQWWWWPQKRGSSATTAALRYFLPLYVRSLRARSLSPPTARPPPLAAPGHACAARCPPTPEKCREVGCEFCEILSVLLCVLSPKFTFLYFAHTHDTYSSSS